MFQLIDLLMWHSQLQSSSVEIPSHCPHRESDFVSTSKHHLFIGSFNYWTWDRSCPHDVTSVFFMKYAWVYFKPHSFERRKTEGRVERLPWASVWGSKRRGFSELAFLTLAFWKGTAREPGYLFRQAGCLAHHISFHPTHSSVITITLKQNTDMKRCFVKQKLCFWIGVSKLPGLCIIWKQEGALTGHSNACSCDLLHRDHTASVSNYFPWKMR